MPAGSSTSNSMSSTNPTLTKLFTSLFGGGAGGTGITTLQSIASGGNTQALDAALTASSTQQTQQGTAQIKEAFGSSGMGSSSSTAKTLSQFLTSQSTSLNSSIATNNLQAQQQQLSAASYISQMFSSSANQYYNSGSNTSSFNPISLFSALFPGGA